MSVPAFATVDDLRARGVDCDDVARTRAAIDDVSALIHHFTSNQWITDGEVSASTPAVVFAVAYKAMGRALAAGDDVVSSQLGPFQETRRNMDGDVYLTGDEKQMLLDTVGSATGLATIRLEAPWPNYRKSAPVGYFAADAEAVDE